MTLKTEKSQLNVKEMEVFIFKYLMPSLTGVIICFRIITFLPVAFSKIIGKNLMYYLKVFSSIFFCLVLLLYILTITEFFENTLKVDFSFSIYTSNIWDSLKYFYEWILIFWSILFFALSFLSTALLFLAREDILGKHMSTRRKRQKSNKKEK